MSTGRLTSVEAKARGYDRDTIARLVLEEEARSAAEALIPLIEKAFDGVPRPKITLNVARGYDDEWNLSEERIAELTAMDPEQTWQEVPDAAMEKHQEYFTFSDAEGWLFYLPAYLCHYLRDFPECGWDAVSSACEAPSLPDLLDEDQMRCVRKFLELCGKYEDHI